MGTAVCLTRNADPITAFVLLNMMFYGMYFVYMPDVKESFKKVKKWWKENKNKFKSK